MPRKPSISNTTTSDAIPAERSSGGTSVNRVILVGRLVAAPELRITSSGRHVTTARVATNDREQPEFHDVVLWNQLADFATAYMAKGCLVYIEGRLQSRTWEATDGTKRHTVEVIADRFQALSSKQADPAAA